MEKQSILVTGAAGFIGAHLCKRLRADGHRVKGIDNFSPYYAPELKRQRFHELARNIGLAAVDLADPFALRIPPGACDLVIHLAAQPGVRHPVAADYIDANLVGFANVLEQCQRGGARLIYASSSSVYGDNPPPHTVGQPINRPLSLYAATKAADELLAHADGQHTGLRFFSVYGPWGRPDMAPMLFAKAIMAGEPLNVYANGQQARDWTYIDDIIDGIVAAMDTPPGIYNLGRGEPVKLLDFIRELEDALGKPAILNLLPAQPGEMAVTWAGGSLIQPRVSLREGVRRFAEWYLPWAA